MAEHHLHECVSAMFALLFKLTIHNLDTSDLLQNPNLTLCECHQHILIISVVLVTVSTSEGLH